MNLSFKETVQAKVSFTWTGTQSTYSNLPIKYVKLECRCVSISTFVSCFSDIGSDRCLSYYDTDDGGAEDMRFDVVAGDAPVIVDNFEFVASGSRDNIGLDIYAYSGSYQVCRGKFVNCFSDSVDRTCVMHCISNGGWACGNEEFSS